MIALHELGSDYTRLSRSIRHGAVPPVEPFRRVRVTRRRVVNGVPLDDASVRPLVRLRLMVHQPDPHSVRAAARLRLVGADGPLVAPAAESYRRLAHVFHEVLSEQSVESLLDKIADALADLVPHDSLTIYRADESQGVLVPVLARDEYADEIMASRTAFGQGITGWAIQHREPVLSNSAHLDPRVQIVPGTPADPEALIAVPLIARGSAKGVLNIYRQGVDASFTAQEFELAQLFGDAAALALDNAEVKARLEHQAQTDSLTGLYNHRFFHERLRAELTRASRQRDSVALVMLDLDDFKRVNDIHGHAVGDELLVTLAELLRAAVREYDVVCRVGGEEFAVIMPSAAAEDALAFARRISDTLGRTEFDTAGALTVSIGVAQGPEHAMNPRELHACAEAAMMTAKARGKSRIVIFGDGDTERPDVRGLEGRSLAHLKMLQSLAGRLNRLNDVAAIGDSIATELRALVDYHNCRVYVAEDDLLVPVAFKGDLTAAGAVEPRIDPLRIGEGVTGTAAATGRSLLIHDGANCEFAVHLYGTQRIDESMIATPLLFGSRTIGAIVISKLGLSQFDEDDVRLLEVLAGHASVALENARLYEAQRREAQKARETAEIANALLDFGRELASARGSEEVLNGVARSSAVLLGAPRATVWLQDAPGDPIRPRAWFGFDDEALARMLAIDVPHAMAVELLARGEPFRVDVDLQEELFGDRGLEAAPQAVAPLLVDGRIGAISVSVADLSDEKLELLAGMANQARLAIANAFGFESLESTFVSTVESLANALEANDEYTSEHARSITNLSLDVGGILGLDAKALKRLELGALFHDIGKIGIPTNILGKPGPLTDEERAVVEQHPELGARILAPIERLADVREIVRAAHERWDGKGYPRGLAGEDIPFESRIIFVCDAYHAMTTDRPYRKALSREEACRRLRENAGTQFDPAAVEAFLSL
jgi:diguanylate cyclase (GGDEF)-like protein